MIRSLCSDIRSSLTTPNAQGKITVEFAIEFFVERPNEKRAELKEVNDQSTDKEDVGKKRDGNEHGFEFIIETHDLK